RNLPRAESLPTQASLLILESRPILENLNLQNRQSRNLPHRPPAWVPRLLRMLASRVGNLARKWRRTRKTVAKKRAAPRIPRRLRQPVHPQNRRSRGAEAARCARFVSFLLLMYALGAGAHEAGDARSRFIEGRTAF